MSFYAFTVDVYSHHFAVSGYNRQGKEAIVYYADQFAEYGYVKKWDGRVTRELKRYFATATRDRMEFRFHITALNAFIETMVNLGFPRKQILVNQHPLYTPGEYDIRTLPFVQPRPHQPPFIEHLVSPGCSKVVTVQTGGGKTIMALIALSRLRRRTMIAIKAMYVERWLGDLIGKKKVMDLSMEDVMVVRGAKDLRALIELAKLKALNVKILIITLDTLRAFYDHYEGFNRDTTFYGCAPYELYELLDVGVRLIDEVHQDFHLNFRQDLYSHVPKTINLSATLESDSDFTNRMYDVMFPPESQINNGEYNKYIGVTAALYHLQDPRAARYTIKGRHSYNHIAYENWIMGDPRLTKRYTTMVLKLVTERFVDVYTKGQKLLVFAGGVEMCTVIRDAIRQAYPDLVVNKYTSEDEYETLLAGDVTVSTLLSSGTAVDIPGLRTVIMTTAIGSSQANLQALGRLRVLADWPDVTPEFIYLVCLDIRSHMDYHKRKLERFRNKVLKHAVVTLEMTI